MPKVNKLYAFVAWNPATPDDEGIMAIHTGSGWMPMVGADVARIESLRPIAEKSAKLADKEFKILMFEEARDVTRGLAGVDNLAEVG